MPDSKFIDVQGLRLHYLEWGAPDAPDVLLVHGSGATAETWTATAEALAHRYHIVAPDLRGHGRSDRPASGYRLSDFVRDLVEFIEGTRLQRAVYVGHSWGGNIGTVLASDYPDLISAALLEDPIYWKMVNAFVTSLVRQLAYIDRTAATDGETDVSRIALTRMLADNRDWAFRCEDHLRRISVPALILVADIEAGGQMIAEEVAYHRTIASPPVEFRVWPGVGHLMHIARPAQFTEEVAAFLARHSAPNGTL